VVILKRFQPTFEVCEGEETGIGVGTKNEDRAVREKKWKTMKTKTIERGTRSTKTRRNESEEVSESA